MNALPLEPLDLLPPEMAGLPEDDRTFLLRAVRLGRRGWGRVHPNPMVGCVLVREGRVVGEGWHRDFGGPHAEVEALREAGDDARGATAYVSLEPCRHHGKTPPCTVALREAGVSRVVFGAPDPGDDSGGGGADLGGQGVPVEGPCMTVREARRENPAFFQAGGPDHPFVALKLAVSLDGMISGAPGARQAVSGPEAHARVQWLRAGFDGILVGRGTALVDDPLLTVRGPLEPVRPPARIVLDPDGELPSHARVLAAAPGGPTLIFVGEWVRESEMERLEAAGAKVHPVPGSPAGTGKPATLDLDRVLRVCRELGMGSVLCEGGGEVASALLAGDRVQRMYLFYAPRTLGPGGVPAFPRALDPSLWGGWEPAANPAPVGRDTLITLDRSADVQRDH